jgi:hypothetical protein
MVRRRSTVLEYEPRSAAIAVAIDVDTGGCNLGAYTWCFETVRGRGWEPSSHDNAPYSHAKRGPIDGVGIYARKLVSVGERHAVL